MKSAYTAKAKVRPRRKATNVTLPADLVAEARALGISLSQEFETHLVTLLRSRRAARWREENRAALAEYARYFEHHGICNEDSRGW